MRKIALFFLVALAAHAQTATISDTLTAAVGGGNWTGRDRRTARALQGDRPKLPSKPAQATGNRLNLYLNSGPQVAKPARLRRRG